MQFSLFGAAALAPTVGDLDGIVLAGGQWVHAAASGRPGARLSVLVDAPWRAMALVEELALRGLGADQAATEVSDLIDVRTDFSADLLTDGQRWTRGARLVAPADLSLSGGGLRLWAIARGRRDEAGYLLGTSALDSSIHRAAGAQLAAAGLTAVGVGERGRPGWRITGLKRIRRCAELLGEAPAGAGTDWPTG